MAQSAATAAAVSHTLHNLRPGVISTHNAKWLTSTKSFVSASGKELVSTPTKRTGILVSCVKTVGPVVNDKSNSLIEKSTSRGATFFSGFEELVVGVCDETQIAELKIKIGDIEMHLKRNIKPAEAPVAIVSPTEPPPIPSKPMDHSVPAAPPAVSTSSIDAKDNPFLNAAVKKSRKFAALEASGATGYVLVSCPTVGSFLKGRTLKGKKQPPVCEEGSVIKEGQTICYLDQFGTELPVKSDVDGEVIKILVDDGEAVGYGDPLIAVLPSFHDTLLS
uniref:biotin carboxyl carrier protein of acetyl-CoA carboxylase-like isoform X2 n=1 Tax=Erigeron canadensis TaxID=72917 RepID=UPI001CB98F3C|nr:biotin carboxyl carrier protein of acetyl-CoA carboxylase-like isoform X2 [Erigeron canadensis]